MQGWRGDGRLRRARTAGANLADLLARALAEARADGFESGSLTVDADSPTGAVGIYERIGFTVTHTSVAQQKELPATT